MSTHFILKANPTEVGGACGVHGLGHGGPPKKARPTPQGRVSKSRSEVLDVTVNRRGKSLVFTDRKYKRKGTMNVGEGNHSEEGNHSGTSDIHGTEKTFLI
mmetsp:Transcript_29205/g.49247  ORF Transcript_29205/g.49247 Transcript_29205/m.49247 type:complete len:101 (-) Transcript_29205:225-527(-)